MRCSRSREARSPVADSSSFLSLSRADKGQPKEFDLKSLLETALSGNFSLVALDGLSVDADDLNEDLFASAEYRAHLVIAMAKHAVAEIAA